MLLQLLDAFSEQFCVASEDWSVHQTRAPQIHPPVSFPVFVLTPLLAMSCVRELKDCAVELRKGFRDFLFSEHSAPVDVFGLRFDRRRSSFFTAFDFLLPIHKSASCTFPAPDCSAEMRTVLVVFVGFLQSLFALLRQGSPSFKSRHSLYYSNHFQDHGIKTYFCTYKKNKNILVYVLVYPFKKYLYVYICHHESIVTNATTFEMEL